MKPFDIAISFSRGKLVIEGDSSGRDVFGVIEGTDAAALAEKMAVFIAAAKVAEKQDRLWCQMAKAEGIALT